MPSKHLTITAILGLLVMSPAPAVAAGELMTLFTTPQERQLINANRYRSEEIEVVEEPELVVQQEDEPEEESPLQILLKKEVNMVYRISGISLSQDGTHSVWINANVYEDGGELEDSSSIKVIAGDDVKVRITAPDGKHYFGTSGETLTVTYMAAVEN